MSSSSNRKEKLICVRCRYEIDYLGTYAKPPVCPHCKNLLSFKESGAVDLSEAVNDSWINRILSVLAVSFLIFAAGFMLRHFKTYDYRELTKVQVRVGEHFYGGLSRSKIPKEWVRMPYSFDTYWNRNFSNSREDVMITEQHGYAYRGTRGGQMEIEYIYSDSKRKKGGKLLLLRVSGNTAYLDIPPIPYVRKSRGTRLKLVQDSSGTQIRVSEFK